MSRLVPVLLVAFFIGCSASPTAPTTTRSLDGVWSGTVVRAGASGTLRLELQTVSLGTAMGATGRYELVDASGATSGDVAGGFVGALATLTLTPSAPPACPGASTPAAGQVSLVLTLDGNRLGGEAAFSRCGLIETGSVTLTRP